MCRPVKCKHCGKTTWAGCGQHVAQVKAGVPQGEWCPGHATEAKAATKGPGSTTSEPASSGGLWSRLTGRR